jgi:hypothetical protein
VASAFRNTRHHRQHGLGPVQGLDLRLLVHAEDQCSFRRVQVEAHDVADLVDEERVRGQLERLGPVRGECECPPDPGDRRLRHAGGGSHRSGRPMGGVLRPLLECLDDDPLDVSVTDLPRCTRPRFVGQAVQAPFDEPPPPGSDRVRGNIQPTGHLQNRVPFGALQHDPRTLGQGLGRRTPTHPPLQHSPLGIGHRQRRNLRTRTTHTQPTTNIRLRSLAGAFMKAPVTPDGVPGWWRAVAGVAVHEG